MPYKKSKFFTPRTAGFLNKIAREYIHSMGQKVLYYKVNAEKSDHTDEYERLFRESRKKYYDEPIELECNVYIDPKNTENFKDVAYELRTFINVFVERELLKNKNINPSIGDVVSFQDIFFRVFDTDDSKMYHGNPNYKYALELNCVDIRINNNENELISDVKYQKSKEEPIKIQLPENGEVYFENALLEKDDETYVNSNYTNDFQTLNVNIKMKITDDELENFIIYFDPTGFTDAELDELDLEAYYDANVFNEPENLDIEYNVSTRSNKNLFFFKGDRTFTIKKTLDDDIEKNSFSIVNGYFILNLSYDVNSESFSVVDELFHFLNSSNEIHNFNFFTF